MSRVERFRRWWDREVKVRVKALVYTAAVLVFLVVGNQVQNYQLNSQRIQDISDRQDQVCQTRITTRNDLRSVLLHVVDLSDVLPGNNDAEAYTQNRIDYINLKYPPITTANC